MLISKESNSGVPSNRLKKQSSKNENFRMKPKRKGSAKNLQVLYDEPPGESTNVDMIKCNLWKTYKFYVMNHQVSRQT